ncbi:hypothetical protein C8F04DRAFT_1192630 [Mycena alexandri]|uniref:Uncharacterized protein n=1 Tax=Mycena alexandri TaxID=1745969 RepID=A0AAD6SAX0_9AGAR|nr:hypothetical protein C8F04DRAFT_1192630 [Mycena alexandri]
MFQGGSKHPHIDDVRVPQTYLLLAMDAYRDCKYSSCRARINCEFNGAPRQFLWEFVEEGQLWATKIRIEWAPTFNDICRFLPLCKKLADAFEVQDHVDVQVAPVYYIVDSSDRVTANIDEAIATWLAVDHEWGAIMTTVSLKEACYIGTDNRLGYGKGTVQLRNFILASPNDLVWMPNT